mmetsp:Transcript_137339/g.342479  ORF Transcript_137339/g.342479 Transcript_137339/m.342479 type:complete len:221 (-) Transcript_137339:693-1355(-)
MRSLTPHLHPPLLLPPPPPRNPRTSRCLTPPHLPPLETRLLQPQWPSPRLLALLPPVQQLVQHFCLVLSQGPPSLVVGCWRWQASWLLWRPLLSLPLWRVSLALLLVLQPLSALPLEPPLFPRYPRPLQKVSFFFLEAAWQAAACRPRVTGVSSAEAPLTTTCWQSRFPKQLLAAAGSSPLMAGSWPPSTQLQRLQPQRPGRRPQLSQGPPSVALLRRAA